MVFSYVARDMRAARNTGDRINESAGEGPAKKRLSAAELRRSKAS